MAHQPHPEDDPFDHSLIKTYPTHSRGESSSNLLDTEEFRDPKADPTSASYAEGGYGYFGDKQEANVEISEAGRKQYGDLEYSDPYNEARAIPIGQQPSALAKALGFSSYSLAQRIDDKRRGIGRQKYPFVCWTLAVVMLGVLIYELVLNAKAQGSPLSFKPVVNPMLGPSQSALINAGARFPPCMRVVQGLSTSTQFACLNDTANPPDQLCPLEDVCGFGGFHGGEPDQWFRFITAIFLHAGIIHFLLNMAAQLTASAEVEREMGSIGFFVVYFASGIFGNILGGNFSLVASPSIGASGAIFGTIAANWIDLFAHWKYQYRPKRKLVIMIIELIIGIAIGFIPYVDNFAHIGGLLMGLLVSMVLYPIISTSKRHIMIVWGLRLVAIALAVVLYVVLIRNFYTTDPSAACSWCRYLSCIPTKANNHCQGTGFTTTPGSSSI